MGHRHLAACVCAIALLAASVLGQTAQQADIDFINRTGKGSPKIPSRVYYPKGLNQPAAVVVFLHGYGAIGREYPAMGRTLAENGYVAVLPETARTDWELQRLDAIAMFSAVGVENGRKGSVLEGRLDLGRVGLAGHSMGGANTVRALAVQAGYRAGVCLAPHGIPPKDQGKVRVPIMFLSGKGDIITPWQGHLMPLFSGERAFTGIKVLYLMGKTAHHFNVALRDHPVLNREDHAVFDRAFSVARGFFDHYLRDDARALDHVVGQGARNAPRLDTFLLAVATPDYYKRGTEAIGKTVEYHLVGASGLAVHMWSPIKTLLQTQWGILRLAPSMIGIGHATLLPNDGVSTMRLPIPKVDALRGLEIYFQAVAMNGAGQLKLTRMLPLSIAK